MPLLLAEPSSRHQWYVPRRFFAPLSINPLSQATGTSLAGSLVLDNIKFNGVTSGVVDGAGTVHLAGGSTTYALPIDRRSARTLTPALVSVNGLKETCTLAPAPLTRSSTARSRAHQRSHRRSSTLPDVSSVAVAPTTQTTLLANSRVSVPPVPLAVSSCLRFVTWDWS